MSGGAARTAASSTAEFIRSRIHAPTDRRYLFALLPLTFAVHPTFYAVNKEIEHEQEESDEVTGFQVEKLSKSIFLQDAAKKAAIEGLETSFTTTMVVVPLMVCVVILCLVRMFGCARCCPDLFALGYKRANMLM